MVTITDSDGDEFALDSRLTWVLEQRPWAIAELLELLITKARLTEAELRDCSILGDDETIAPEPRPTPAEVLDDAIRGTARRSQGPVTALTTEEASFLLTALITAYHTVSVEEIFADNYPKETMRSALEKLKLWGGT